MHEHEIIELIKETRRELMAAIDDLNTAVSQLQTDVQTLITMFQNADQSPAIEQATATITALDQSVTAITAPPEPPA